MVSNDNYKSQQDKWLWTLHDFLTAEVIQKRYKILREELPPSLRQMPLFRRQLQQRLDIEESFVDDTDWFDVQQITWLKLNVKVPTVTIILIAATI